MLDFVLAFLFWQWYELLGLPLRFALARTRLGAIERRVLSRIAGPVLLAFPVWFAARVVPGALAAVAGILWFAACLALAWQYASPGAGLNLQERLKRLLAWDIIDPNDPTRRRKLTFHIVFELTCFVLFFGFVAFRRWVPEMTSDIGASAAEKFMNQMLFWANWHARALPAEDYWFAGHPILYYDWAHWHWAWVARIAGFPAQKSLNLAFARVTLLTMEATFLLGRALGLRKGWALGGAVASTWFGNPAGVTAAWNLITIWRQFGVDWGGYDFWEPSRAIKNVVDEFPAFSAILGDFHAHHLALPWLLTFFALLAFGLRRIGRPLLWGTLCVALAAAATLSNAWNLPVIGGAVGLVLLICFIRRPRIAWLYFIYAVLLGGLLALLLRFQRGGAALPMDPPPPGARIWEKLGWYLVDPQYRSTPLELFNLWGIPLTLLLLAAIAGLLALLATRLPRSSARQGSALFLSVTGGILIVFGLLAASMGFFIMLGLLAILFAVALLQPKLWAWRMTAATLGALLLLALLELIYLQDRFRGDYARYNSYFKFSYSAWPVLMLAGAAALEAVWRVARRMRLLPVKLVQYMLFGLGCVAAASGLVYPVFSFPGRIFAAERGDAYPRSPTLNSVTFIAHRTDSMEDAPLLDYIRMHIPYTDRIIEAGADGRSEASPGCYNFGGRVATLTGHPVPLGWIAHEQQWRGPPFYVELDQRATQVANFYQAPSPEAMRAAARVLGARWAVYGIKERSRYGPAALNMLLRTARVEVSFLAPGEKAEKGNGVFLFDLTPSTLTLK